MSFSSTVVSTESEKSLLKLKKEVPEKPLENGNGYKSKEIETSQEFIINKEALIDYLKSIKLQSLALGAFTVLFSLQLIGKLILPQIMNRLRANSDLIKIHEAEIDLTNLFASYNRQLALVQHHNDSIYHDFRVNVNETTSTITITSSILTTGRNRSSNATTPNQLYRSMQISSVKIRMANLSNSDIVLSTQFISNLINSSSEFNDRHKEFVEL